MPAFEHSTLLRIAVPSANETVRIRKSEGVFLPFINHSYPECALLPIRILIVDHRAGVSIAEKKKSLPGIRRSLQGSITPRILPRNFLFYVTFFRNDTRAVARCPFAIHLSKALTPVFCAF